MYSTVSTILTTANLLNYFLKLETDYAIIVSGFLDPFLTIYLLT